MSDLPCTLNIDTLSLSLRMCLNRLLETLYDFQVLGFLASKDTVNSLVFITSRKSKPEDQWSCKRSPDILA